MNLLPTLAEAVAAHARFTPHKLAVRDSRRSLSYAQWLARSRRLANALLGLGLAHLGLGNRLHRGIGRHLGVAVQAGARVSRVRRDPAAELQALDRGRRAGRLYALPGGR